MNCKYSHILLVILVCSLFLSCKEKEYKMDSSADMLFSVRTSSPILELEDTSYRDIIEKELMNMLVFTKELSVIEMKHDKTHLFEAFKNLDYFKRDKNPLIGHYSFASDKMEVTFIIEDKEHTFSISGHLGDVFYNHFTLQNGMGESHIIESSGVFCLNDNYTAYFIEKYPDAGITIALIKTDMLNMRMLETFK